MCLSTIAPRKPTPSGVGYKVMAREGRRYKPQFTHVYGNPMMQRRVWYHKKFSHLQKEFLSTTPLLSHYTMRDVHAYSAGFHIFPDLETAKEWLAHYQVRDGNGGRDVVVKVKYRGAHTQGAQHVGYLDTEGRLAVRHCIVADEILIVGEP